MSSSDDYRYVGDELELFAEARNWKAAWSARVRPWLTGRVLEVGAGIGTNTPLLKDATRVTEWICLEPDAELAEALRDRLDGLPVAAEIRVGTTAELPAEETFDTLVYIDVLEHIEDDRGEVGRARNHLKPGGRLVVLGPAHQALFSPFDRSVGHYRRYDRRSLEGVTVPGLTVERIEYLDSVGYLASAANRWILRSGMPTRGQIRFWDRVLVPCSRLLDPVLGRRVGKSILGVWRRREPSDP